MCGMNTHPSVMSFDEVRVNMSHGIRKHNRPYAKFWAGTHQFSDFEMLMAA
jgi:hypothetical protein